MICTVCYRTNTTSDQFWFVGTLNDFDSQWYSQIGTPIILVQVLQIFTPHIGIILHYLGAIFSRFRDRGYSLNQRVSAQVVQAEYEDVYTGPPFDL